MKNITVALQKKIVILVNMKEIRNENILSEVMLDLNEVSPYTIQTNGHTLTLINKKTGLPVGEKEK